MLVRPCTPSRLALAPHAYRLNTPPGVPPVFHTWLLKSAATDPLPSQISPPYEPPADFLPDVDGDLQEEWAVEDILDEREIGRRGHKKKQLLVKWVGYTDPTWEPREALEDVDAFDRFLTRREGREREHVEGEA